MNIIKLTKKSNALFFAALLLVGTIAASSPLFMLVAQAEPYYGMDKDRKVVSVSSLKCNNINVNVNGLELEILPSALSALLTGEEADASAYSYGSGTGNYGSGQSSSENDFRFICINNNNNNNIVVGGREGGGNVIEPTATLAVTKTVTCTPNDTSPQAAATCQLILSNTPPSSFNIIVTGNNANPSIFAGSNDPMIVNLGAGNYELTEEGPFVVPPGGIGITSSTTFTGDCIDANPNNQQSTETTGTIEAGESQTCDIRNDYRPFLLPPPVGLTASNINTDTSSLNINTAGGLTASFSPSTIAQGIGNAPELTATEKIVKLKQQWMELLP